MTMMIVLSKIVDNYWTMIIVLSIIVQNYMAVMIVLSKIVQAGEKNSKHTPNTHALNPEMHCKQTLNIHALNPERCISSERKKCTHSIREDA